MQGGNSATGRCAAKSPYNPDHRSSFKRHIANAVSQEAVIFDAKDADDLDRQICDGRFDCVVFDTFDDLLEMIWNEDADFARWRERGVRVDILKDGGVDSQRLEFLLEAHNSLCRWRTRRKRQRLIVATVLSFVALVALAILFMLVPFAR